MSTSRYDHASPSVTLEKGAYRMRAPRSRVPASRRRGSVARNPELFSTREKYYAVLVFMLVSATATCFGTAYYLFTTRWDSPVHNPMLTWYSDEAVQVVPYDLDDELRAFAPGPQDRFLAYLPHSGFHNQRIAFENALVLSRLLNRTLLVPPIRLGEKPLRYVKFDALRQYLVLSGKEGLHHCSNVPLHIPLPEECLDYLDYTHIPWEWLVNLTEVKANQRLLQVWNFTEQWMYDNLRIPINDTLTLRDANPYHYRFLDNIMDVSPSKDKYTESIYIPSLLNSSERLIQLGTLFGSSRLRLKMPESLCIRRDVRKSMTFSNPLLLDTADSIRDALGGVYLGAHVRVGDGHFKAEGQTNARLEWWRLVHEILGYESDETLKLEHNIRLPRTLNVKLQPPSLSVDVAARRVPHPPLARLPKIFMPHLPCRGAKHASRRLKPLNIPLFISTDAKDPLNDPAIIAFLQTFPCTFFLSDFPTYTATLSVLKNGYDGVHMRDFLIPILDAMVVGKARDVVGTEGSTFSRFVQDVLWRTYHGWEIVQRG
jgi:GDP-fucose protein O-fucosyltransferase